MTGGCLDSLMTTSDTHRFICTHPSPSPFFTNQASAARSEFRQYRIGQVKIPGYVALGIKAIEKLMFGETVASVGGKKP
jgi:hypothetical protein